MKSTYYKLGNDYWIANGTSKSYPNTRHYNGALIIHGVYQLAKPEHDYFGIWLSEYYFKQYVKNEVEGKDYVIVPAIR